MVRLVFRHFAADERFARPYRNEPSSEIPLTLPFSGIFRGFFRVLLLLKPLSRSRSVAGVNVCVRVCVCLWVCMLCAVWVWKNTENHKKQREMRVVWCVCCVVLWGEKMWKNARNNGKLVKTWSPFLARYGHPWTRKRSQIGHFPQRLVFTLPLGFADDFGPRS